MGLQFLSKSSYWLVWNRPISHFLRLLVEEMERISRNKGQDLGFAQENTEGILRGQGDIYPRDSVANLEEKVNSRFPILEGQNPSQRGEAMHEFQQELEYHKARMLAAQQELRQVEEVVESMRNELVELLRRKLYLKRPTEEERRDTSVQSGVEELNSQISDVRELISDTEDMLKELVKGYEAKKAVFGRVLEQEKLSRAIRSQEHGFELQNVHNGPLTDGELASRVTQKESRKVQVPQNLPKFRQKGQFDEPIEFLEAFRRMMEAHEVPLGRYMKVLPLCLDAVDCKWFEEWTGQQEENVTWQELERAFIAHFQNPNAKLV